MGKQQCRNFEVAEGGGMYQAATVSATLGALREATGNNGEVTGSNGAGNFEGAEDGNGMQLGSNGDQREATLSATLSLMHAREGHVEAMRR